MNSSAPERGPEKHPVLDILAVSHCWAGRDVQEPGELGKDPKIKQSESTVFDHRRGMGGDRPKSNPFSDLEKDLKLKILLLVVMLCGKME